MQRTFEAAPLAEEAGEKKRVRLTVATLKKLAAHPPEVTYEVADAETRGLRLRVLPSGGLVFRWGVRSLNKVVTIGRWVESPTPGHVTLAEARVWLLRLKEARRAGADQLATVEARLRAELSPVPAAKAVAGITLGEVFERWLSVLKRKRLAETARLVRKDIIDEIGARPLASVDKATCRELIEAIVARGAPVHAGKILGLLKQGLDFAENVEDNFVNPAARLKAGNLGVENNSRDRWLSDVEIPLFWRALDMDPPGSPKRSVPDPTTAAALRTLLLTCARSGELRAARWEHVDFAAATWTVPPSSQKLTLKQAQRAKPFVIPLAPMAVALFEELKALAGDSEWVLASDAAKDGKLAEKSLGKAMRRMWRTHPELKALPEASPHDLRRTARTWLGQLGTPPHIAERCLNHSIGRIQATYDQGDYLSERRAALEKWAAFVARCLAPDSSTVVFLPAANAR